MEPRSTTTKENAISQTRRLDHDLLSTQEVEALLKSCSRSAPTGVRNRALIAVLWRCGLRIGEALALLPKDIDVQGGTVTVQHGKGDKRRVVGLDPGTTALLQQWLAKRSVRVRSRTAPVFCTLGGHQIDQSYVRHLLPRLARRAGIDKRVHCHGLRHRHAVDLVKEGADLLTVRDLLGHSSAATTQTYLSRIGASDAVEFARKREWSAV
jgi:site-specific recombinase XerD